MHTLALVLDSTLSNHLEQWVFHFGLLGLFLVSIVDSSFVPLPVPGISD